MNQKNIKHNWEKIEKGNVDKKSLKMAHCELEMIQKMS